MHAAAYERPSTLVPAGEATRIAAELLGANGVPSADAATIARCLVRADLRGVDSHGITRLPGYLDRLRRGLIRPDPELVPERIALATARLDGQDGFGFVVATRAMAEATSIATTTGIGMVGVRRSTHFGMAANYALQAIEAGFIGIVFTNASPGMAPFGARDAIIGTSPLAAGAPGGALGPFVLDMSPAVVARGRIRRAVRHGEPIPEGWALDADGRPTTDPAAALAGVMLPIGGPKGSGISMLMDILGGVLTGAAFAGRVGDMTKEFDRPQDVGHLLVAIRPDLFLPRDEYLARMDTLIARIHEARPAAGFNEVLVPGELEARREREREVSGIPYDPADLAGLDDEADRVGVRRLGS